MEQQFLPTYEYHPLRNLIASYAGMGLEAAQNIPHIHEYMPEPFDITNHGGNMWVGTFIASAFAIAYAIKNHTKNDRALEISAQSMRRFRKFGIATACATTALVNCITETRWGVDHLPLAEWLHGTVPDVLDTAYSVATAGLVSAWVWKKRPPERPFVSQD